MSRPYAFMAKSFEQEMIESREITAGERQRSPGRIVCAELYCPLCEHEWHASAGRGRGEIHHSIEGATSSCPKCSNSGRISTSPQ